MWGGWQMRRGIGEKSHTPEKMCGVSGISGNPSENPSFKKIVVGVK